MIFTDEQFMRAIAHLPIDETAHKAGVARAATMLRDKIDADFLAEQKRLKK